MQPDGNVCLTAEIDYSGNDGEFLISIACGSDSAESGQQARAGLLDDFEKTQTLFRTQWEERQSEYSPIEDLSGSDLDMYRVEYGRSGDTSVQEISGSLHRELVFALGL